MVAKKANDSILDEDFVSFCFWSSSLQCFLTTWRNLIGRLVHRISLYEHLDWIDWVSRWSWEASHVFILYNKITRRTEINCQYANKDSSTFFSSYGAVGAAHRADRKECALQQSGRGNIPCRCKWRTMGLRYGVRRRPTAQWLVPLGETFQIFGIDRIKSLSRCTTRKEIEIARRLNASIFEWSHPIRTNRFVHERC